MPSSVQNPNFVENKTEIKNTEISKKKFYSKQHKKACQKYKII